VGLFSRLDHLTVILNAAFIKIADAMLAYGVVKS